MSLHLRLAEMHHTLQLQAGLDAHAATNELRAVCENLPDGYKFRRVTPYRGETKSPHIYIAWAYNLALMVALLVLLYGYYLTLQHASHFKAAEFWRTFFLVSFIEPFATSFVRLLVVKLTVAMLSFCLLGACRRRDAEDRLASWRGKKLGAGVAKAKTANLGLHLAALKDIRARPAALRARALHRNHPAAIYDAPRFCTVI